MHQRLDRRAPFAHAALHQPFVGAVQIVALLIGEQVRLHRELSPGAPGTVGAAPGGGRVAHRSAGRDTDGDRARRQYGPPVHGPNSTEASSFLVLGRLLRVLVGTKSLAPR